jgi:restriction system protein
MSFQSEQGFIDRLARLPWPTVVACGVMGVAIIEWGLPWAFRGAGAGPRAVFDAVRATGLLDPLAGVVLTGSLALAALSYLRAGRHARLRAAQDQLRAIPAPSWETFRQTLAEAFRQRGFAIDDEAGAARQADLVLVKDGATTLVQCEHWRSNYVGVSVVRALQAAMDAQRADAGKLVCAGVFSSDCYRFAVGKPIELLDGEAVRRLAAQVRADAAMQAAPMA